IGTGRRQRQLRHPRKCLFAHPLLVAAAHFTDLGATVPGAVSFAFLTIISRTARVCFGHTMKISISARQASMRDTPARIVSADPAYSNVPKTESDKSQSERFVESAPEIGCDGDEAVFRDNLRVIARQKPKPDKK